MERKTMASMALLFALTTFVLWGTTNFLIGYGEKQAGIDPKVFTAIMWISMGVLGVVLFAYLRLTGTPITLDKNLLLPVAAGTLLGIGILAFTFAMHQGDMDTGPTAAIATSNAVFTAMLAFVVMRENLDFKEWVGIATVVLGIVILRI